LENLSLTITAKGSNNGKLFGSITSKEISEVLKTIHHIDIDKKKISLNETIKNIGEYTVDIKLYTEISAKITVRVVE
jgi:large subunit ribosomal protein L9